MERERERESPNERPGAREKEESYGKNNVPDQLYIYLSSWIQKARVTKNAPTLLVCCTKLG